MWSHTTHLDEKLATKGLKVLKPKVGPKTPEQAQSTLALSVISRPQSLPTERQNGQLFYMLLGSR